MGLIDKNVSYPGVSLVSNPSFSDGEAVFPGVFVVDGVADFGGLVGVGFGVGYWPGLPSVGDEGF